MSERSPIFTPNDTLVVVGLAESGGEYLRRYVGEPELMPVSVAVCALFKQDFVPGQNFPLVRFPEGGLNSLDIAREDEIVLLGKAEDGRHRVATFIRAAPRNGVERLLIGIGGEAVFAALLNEAPRGMGYDFRLRHQLDRWMRAVISGVKTVERISR